MPFPPLFSVIVPLIGAVILLLMSLFRRLRSYTRFVAPAAMGLTLLGVLAVPVEPLRTIPLSLWRPSAFFGTFLALRTAPVTWALAMAATAAGVSAALIQLSRRTRPHFILVLSGLGFLLATLGSLWAENLLTLLFFWGCFDAAWALGMMAVGASPRRVALSLGIALLATASLWAAALLTRAGGGSLTWQLIEPEGLARTLLLAAGLLRLGLYPIHVNLPVGISRSAPAAAHLFLGPVLGWGLLLRLVTDAGISLADPVWLSSLGVATLAVGSLLSWTRSVASETLPWAALATAGATLAAAAFARDAAPLVLASGGTAWVLGVTLIALADGFDRSAPWWAIGPALGGLALVGAPLTLGQAISAHTIGSAGLPAPQLALTLVALALLVAGIARRIIRPPLSWGDEGLLEIAGRAGGFLLPVLLLLLGGIRPSLLLSGLDVPSSTVPLLRWGLWLLALVMGGGFVWLGARFRKRIEPLLDLLFDLFSLDWLLYTLVGGFDRATSLLREAAELIEGAGAVLWAVSILLLALLALVGPR